MVILYLLLALAATAATPPNVPAFPGAEGYGAATPGGRGGKVLIVRNLNDSGPGSFREAIATRGPRIVVFRVAGIIDLKSDIKITEPYLTIADSPRQAMASACAAAASASTRTTSSCATCECAPAIHRAGLSMRSPSAGTRAM